MMEFFSADMQKQTARTLSGYMRDLGMNTFVGFADDASAETWAPFLAEEQIDAAFHWIKRDGACYSGDPKLYPNVQWVGGKPVVRGRMSLWNSAPTATKYPNLCGDPSSVATTLNALPKDGTEQSFSMVPVRIHGSKPCGLVDIAKTIASLGPGVEVVGAFEFVERLKRLKPAAANKTMS